MYMTWLTSMLCCLYNCLFEPLVCAPAPHHSLCRVHIAIGQYLQKAGKERTGACIVAACQSLRVLVQVAVYIVMVALCIVLFVVCIVLFTVMFIVVIVASIVFRNEVLIPVGAEALLVAREELQIWTIVVVAIL